MAKAVCPPFGVGLYNQSHDPLRAVTHLAPQGIFYIAGETAHRVFQMHSQFHGAAINR